MASFYLVFHVLCLAKMKGMSFKKGPLSESFFFEKNRTE